MCDELVSDGVVEFFFSADFPRVVCMISSEVLEELLASLALELLVPLLFLGFEMLFWFEEEFVWADSREDSSY